MRIVTFHWHIIYGAFKKIIRPKVVFVSIHGGFSTYVGAVVASQQDGLECQAK